jgi:hypothetical protein
MKMCSWWWGLVQHAAVAAVSEAAATIIARVKAASGGSTLRPDLKGTLPSKRLVTHPNGCKPSESVWKKELKDLSASSFSHLFTSNTVF